MIGNADRKAGRRLRTALFAATAGLALAASAPSRALATQYPGLYRGTVVASIDPMLQGRLFVSVPSIPGFVTSWAVPSLPYPQKPRAPTKQPPIGSTVWIEFEAGNVDFPVWVGWLPN